MQTFARNFIVVLLFLAPRGFPQDLNWGISAEGFELGLGVEKKTFISGEPIMATTVIRNLTADPRSLLWYLGPEQAYWLSITRDSKPLYCGPRTSSIIGERVLSPGGAETNEIQINKQFNLYEPGTYVVTVTRAVPRRTHTGPLFPPDMLTVESGAAIIQVVTKEGSENVSPHSSAAPSASAAEPPTVPNSASNSVGTGGIKLFGNKSLPRQGSSGVLTSGQGDPESTLATASPFMTSHFTRTQKMVIGLITALFALLFGILWRAARRKRV